MREFLLILFIQFTVFTCYSQNYYKLECDFSTTGTVSRARTIVNVLKANGNSEEVFVDYFEGVNGEKNIISVLNLDSKIIEFTVEVFWFQAEKLPIGSCRNSEAIIYDSASCNSTLSVNCNSNGTSSGLPGSVNSVVQINGINIVSPEINEPFSQCSPISIPVIANCNNLDVDKWYYTLQDGTIQYLDGHDGENPIVFLPSELSKNSVDYINNPVKLTARFVLYPKAFNTIIDIKACSPTLIPELTSTGNTSCYGTNDGAVTLTFDNDVDRAEGYEMRYFIYQGDPPENPGLLDLESDNPPFPNQAFADPLGIDMEPLADGSGNYSGTYAGLDGSSTVDNGNTILNHADYYIIYQEVRYNFPNPGDVEVKSGNITPMFTIARPTEISLSLENIIQPNCAGEMGSVTLTGQGGGFPPNENISLEYGIQGDDDSWQLEPTFSDLASGTYIFLARSTDGCVSLPTDQITISEPTELTFSTPSHGKTSSSIAMDGVISIYYDGGTPNYTFELTKENETTLEFETITNPKLFHNSLNQKVEFQELGIGTYRVTITDTKGCNLTSENIEVTTIPPPEIVDQQVNQIVCPNGSDGSISLSISGGVLNYNYQWTINGLISPIQTTGNQTISLNNLSEPGEYILKVASTGFTDFNEPSGYASTTITMNTPEEVIITSVEPTNISCLGAQDGSIAISTSGGLNYEYKLDFFDIWKPLNNGMIPISNGGFYDVYLRNENNCEANPVINVLVSEPDELTVSSTSDNATTNGGNQGSITLNIVGGTPFSGPAEPYVISWTKDGQPYSIPTGSTGSNLINLEAGEYIAQITDANGCSSTSNPPITINQPDPLEINSVLIQKEISCLDAADGIIIADVNGTSPITFEWYLNGFPFRTLIDNNTLTDIGPGDYQLFLNDESSNTPLESEVITVTSPLPISVTTDISPISCYGGNDGIIRVNVIGGTGRLNYQITGRSQQTSPLFDNLFSGTYSLIVTDENGCTSVPIDVFVPESTAIQISENTIVPVSVSGGNNGAISISVLGGTSPYTFEWSGPNGYTNTTQNISNLSTGSYTLIIRSSGNQGGIDGCYATETFFVDEPGPLAISNITTTDVNCKGESTAGITTTVTGQGNILYAWTMADGSPIVMSNGTDGPNISGIAAGSYILTATNSIATVSTNPIIIAEPLSPLAVTNIYVTDASCSGSSDGSLQIEASGGTAPYTYSLNGTDYQSSNVFNNLLSGDYTIHIQDNKGCTLSSNTVALQQPQPLYFSIDEQHTISSPNASDGAIGITAWGGTGDLNYSWTGPNGFTSMDEDIIDLAAGDYVLTITDNNYVLNNDHGCMLISDPITISEPRALIVDLVQTVMLECNGDDFGEITATVQGGVHPYTYEWFEATHSNSILEENTEIIGNLSAGQYFVRVTDANAISVDATPINIEQPEILEIIADEITNVLCDGSADGIITVSVSGGTGPYNYYWSNGSTDKNLSGLESGEYTVEVYDDNGCYTEATFTIQPTSDPVHIINAAVSNNSEYMANDASISIEIGGGTSPYAIDWVRLSDNMAMGSNPEITNLQADSYEVFISDATGCFISETFEISEPGIVEETIKHPSCSGQNDGSIEVIVDQGNGNFFYSWDTGQTTNNIYDLAPGEYTLTINGLGDVPLTRTYLIEEPRSLEIDLGGDRTLCSGQELVLNASIDDYNATYSWTSDNEFYSTAPSVTINKSGTYSVVVSNQYGCTGNASVFVDVSNDEITAEFAVSSQVFVGEPLIAVDISYPLPETQTWILPEGATILKEDSDETEMVFSEPGEYEIGIITQNGECFAEQTKKILVVKNEILTEEGQIEPDRLITDFIIYPNPTNGKFTADIGLSERGNINIKIFNFANNALMSSKKDRGESSYTIPFDLSGLPSGVYAVLLETPFGNSLRKVILK
ncbi:T9SS C-terminal target domain-containing protein [Arenibacter aquaticus]|uniref:T9SS C-terminal target domain-containing protein n=1 Tax=Arenibacter aquaticus TaxID=2489054 RepID=A0A430K6N2_9FLAO|nr:T9SS type A sorting domain-containing protein [Arenibacter aquaticus]RTE54650.1 T9SS C-terminal target domain-containing protein [Arenibacter aquaticus]